MQGSRVLMENNTTQNEHDRQKGAQELGRLGYAQELFRDMGGFSNFAISFSMAFSMALLTKSA